MVLSKADREYIVQAVKLGILEAHIEQRKVCSDYFDLRYEKRNGVAYSHPEKPSKLSLLKRPDPYYIIAIASLAAYEVLKHFGVV